MGAKCQQTTNWIHKHNPELCELDNGASVDEMDIVGNQAMTNRLKMSSEKHSNSILDAYENETDKEKTNKGKISGVSLPYERCQTLYDTIWAHDGSAISFEGYTNYHELNTGGTQNSVSFVALPTSCKP